MPTAIDGILLIDKPKGLSSNAVLQRVKRHLGAKKAGHTGSLDPLATGMLPICLGEATKFSQYLLDADKAYEVVATLGAKSDTGDAEGQLMPVIPEKPVQITPERLESVLKQFVGHIQQVPPMYSALKHQGKPLYTYARRGETLERPARPVVIYDINCINHDDKSLHLFVKCSKGTYIRTLVEDIGDALGVGAYVSVLHRTYTAGFENEPMWPLDAADVKHLLPVTRAVAQFPVCVVDEVMYAALYQGKIVKAPEDSTPGIVQLHDKKHCFFGLGEITMDGDLKVKRLQSCCN